jgi:hypothetical protein
MGSEYLPAVPEVADDAIQGRVLKGYNLVYNYGVGVGHPNL